jgi:hypothetical protein
MRDTQLGILVIMALVFVLGMIFARVVRPADEALFGAMSALTGGAVSVIYRHMDGDKGGK